jgi:hypothetical protein
MRTTRGHTHNKGSFFITFFGIKPNSVNSIETSYLTEADRLKSSMQVEQAGQNDADKTLGVELK